MPLAEPYQTNLPLIGSRLIIIESRSPGLVRMRINPDPEKAAAASQDLQEAGFKKRFLQSPQQFIFDCVLSYQQAIEMWLPFSELHALQADRVHIWIGYGRYGGWQGPLAATDFSGIGGKRGERMLLLIDITPFYSQLSDLLDPIRQIK